MQTTPTSSPFANIDNVQSALNANSISSKALEIGDSLNNDFSLATQNNPNLTAGLENTQLDNSKSLKIFKKPTNNSKSLIKSPTKSLIANNELDYNVDYSEELKREINFYQRQNRDYIPILQYNKQPFSELIFPNFTAMDFNLFMCFCFVAKEKGRAKIKVSFNDLNYLMGLDDKKHKDGIKYKTTKIDRNSKRLFQNFDKFVQKALQTVIKISKNDGKYSTNTYTGFFDFIKIYEKERVIVIAFNEFMVSALNGFKFTRFYTQFELKQYCSLNSKHSKQLYLLLMNNLYMKKSLLIDKSRLVDYLGFKKVEQTDLKKTLDNVESELKPMFETFSIEKIMKDKSREIIAYNFVYSK